MTFTPRSPITPAPQDAFGELTGLQAGTEYTLLSVNDQWLKALGGSPDDSAWLEYANRLFVTGSLDGRTRSDVGPEEISSARRSFFGAALGWSESNHSLHKVFVPPETRGYLPVVSTFVGAMRFGCVFEVDPCRVVTDLAFPRASFTDTLRTNTNHMIRRGLDPKRIAKKRLPALRRTPKSVDEYWDLFEEQGYDPVPMIHANPRVMEIEKTGLKSITSNLTEMFGAQAQTMTLAWPGLVATKPETLRTKFNYIQDAAERLNWMYGAYELFTVKPAVAGYSIDRDKVHEALFAAIGKRDMSPTQAGDMLAEAPRDCLYAIGEGVGLSTAYTKSYVRRATKEVSIAERQAALDALLTTPEFVAIVGSRAVAAYEDYRDKQPQEKIAQA